jgi:hypothetical protein
MCLTIQGAVALEVVTSPGVDYAAFVPEPHSKPTDDGFDANAILSKLEVFDVISEDILTNLRSKLATFKGRCHSMKKPRRGPASDSSEGRLRSGSSTSQADLTTSIPGRPASGSYDGTASMSGDGLVIPDPMRSPLLPSGFPPASPRELGVGGVGSFVRARSSGSESSNSFSGSGSYVWDAAGHLVMDSGVPRTYSPHLPGSGAVMDGGTGMALPQPEVPLVKRTFKVGSMNISDPLDPCSNLCGSVSAGTAATCRQRFADGASRVLVRVCVMLHALPLVVSRVSCVPWRVEICVNPLQMLLHEMTIAGMDSAASGALWASFTSTMFPTLATHQPPPEAETLFDTLEPNVPSVLQQIECVWIFDNRRLRVGSVLIACVCVCWHAGTAPCCLNLT